MKIKNKLLFFVVLFPNAISLIYFFGIASPLYQSTAQVMIETTLPHSAIGQSSLTSYAPGRVKNAYTLKNIILSWSGFEHVCKTVPFKKWSADGDFVTAYGGLLNGFTGSDIQLWRYYDQHLSLSIDKNDGILTATYTGYNPARSQKVLQAALSYGERRISQTGQMIRASRLVAAKHAVSSAETALDKANHDLSTYRKKNAIYNPTLFYQNELRILNGLTLKAAELQSQEAALSQSAPKSQTISAYKQGIASLRAKITETQKYALDSSNKAHFYPVLAANQSIAEKILELARENEQKAITEAASPSFLVITLSNPSAPLGSSGPNRLLDAFIVLVVTVLAWSFLR